MPVLYEVLTSQLKLGEESQPGINLRHDFFVTGDQSLGSGQVRSQVWRRDLGHDLTGPGHQFPVVVKVSLDLMVLSEFVLPLTGEIEEVLYRLI